MEPTADQIDSADLLVAVLGEFDSNGTATMCDALRTLPAKLRIAVSHDGQEESAAPVNAKPTQESASVFFVPSLLAKTSTLAARVQSMSETYQSAFAAADKLQARGCCIIASKFEAVTRSWVLRMAQPLFEGQADLVLPHYAWRKFDGPLNTSLIAPMTRALYESESTIRWVRTSGFRGGCFKECLPQEAGAPSAATACTRWPRLRVRPFARTFRTPRCI